MGNEQFERYTAPEFVQEFFRTLLDILAGTVYAMGHIVSSLGPLKLLVAAYLVLLLAAVASELKKYRRRQQQEVRKLEQRIVEQRTQEQRRLQERDERINQYKQRDSKRKTVQKNGPVIAAPRQTSKIPYQSGYRSKT